MLQRTVCACRPIQKLMVANRGEIASRVFRTCHDLGIRTVALFCEAERNAKHVMEADEAVCIGPPPASASYLRGSHIVAVAKRLSVDAIHPGYGFLSENADFANAVSDAGIEFIGPPASAISAMGSKSESKRIMEAAGVPVVPGYHGDDQHPELLKREADRIGYPVLVKAVSGGGGKGMKIVRSPEEFELQLASAKREATSFFKDDRVILERYISAPRHIECQVFCDKKGNGVFFFERDCSVQRRYQKVLEEAPAPHLPEATRQRIGEIALRAAKAVGYAGAGTVEFIFDTVSNEFFFMEMNTRLQVEHPVTEEVCRVKGAPLDLVKLQIQTAMDLPLGFTQGDVELVGSCIEARVYAESPEKGFLPESGLLRYIREPRQGTHGATKVRLDTGFRSGDSVLVHYDPMISKLIVWGEDRVKALKGLRNALDEYQIVGINTNVEFLKRCCEHAAFVEGGVTTSFIADHEAALLPKCSTPTHVFVIAALSRVMHNQRRGSLCHVLRLNANYEVAVPFLSDSDQLLQVRLSATGRHDVVAFSVGGGDEATGTVLIGRLREGGNSAVQDVTLFFSGERRYQATTVATSREVAVVLEGTVHRVRLFPLSESFGDASVQGGSSARVVSPMPGKVGKLLVRSGDKVARGQPILVLEAMKMEHPIKAARDGVVTFTVCEGDMVAGDFTVGSVSEV